MKRGTKGADLRQLRIRVRAVLLALDDALTQSAEVLATAQGAAAAPQATATEEEIEGLLQELRADLTDLSAEEHAQLSQAEDWARRAQIALEAGRLEAAAHALERQAYYVRAAADFAGEAARVRALLGEAGRR